MADHGEGERRDAGREPIELKVEYNRLNAFFADYTKNISKGGTFIKTEKPLPIGTDFLFQLFVPRLDGPLAILGRVKWVVNTDDAEGREPGMGIRFQYDSDEERAGIEELVERLMVDSLGQLLYSKLMEQSRENDDSDGDTEGDS